jgi:nitroreductase
MEFFEVLRARRSIRRFQPQAVSRETITQVLDAVRSAPTAGNLQAYHVYVVQNPRMIRGLTDASDGQECVAQAACVLVFCTDAPRSEVRYKERGRTLYCIQDTTIAATFAHVAATALGLGSVLVGAFDESRVAKTIGASVSHRPLLMLPLGYPAESPEPTERRALDEMVRYAR